MEPVTIGPCTLYHADCRDVLPTLEGVDAVVTDPPYGIGFNGEPWDADIPNWLPAARDISPVVVFTTAPTTQWDYPRPDWVCCWYRPASSSRSQLRGGFNHWSPVLIYGTPAFPVDTINLHAIAHSQKPGFWHPSPKPLALMRWLVVNSVPEGATVADPFMGSATTAVECVKQGRRFIGIERDPVYFDRACRRIRDAVTAERSSLFPAWGDL